MAQQDSGAESQHQQPIFATLRAWHAAYCNLDTHHGPELQVLDHDPRMNPLAQAQKAQEAADALRIHNGFCEACSHLFTHWPSPGSVRKAITVSAPWSCSGLQIQAAALKGCRLCYMLSCALDYNANWDLIYKLECRLTTLGKDKTSSLSIKFYPDFEGVVLILRLPGLSCPNRDLTMSTAMLHAEVRPHHSELIQRSNAKTGASAEDWTTISRRWISDCTSTHKCIADAAHRPSRLISVRNQNVHLVTTTQFTDCPRYATLSYSWGTAKFLMLRRSNISQFFTAIPIHSLPSIFREAINVTRALGIDYIWIDALCIIQGDNEDWLQESVLMRSVYGGAYVNITVSSSTSVNGSLFTAPPHHWTGFVTDIQDQQGRHKLLLYVADAPQSAILNSHLSTRGWTHQERLLSSRSLYFSDDGMFWNCHSLTASNCLPGGHPCHSSIDQRREDGTFSWTDVSLDFSCADLTHASDKLTAFAGIARAQYELKGGRYLAGLWEADLISQLCWQARSVGDQRHSRPAWRAPTWSWMSVDGPVRFPTVSTVIELEDLVTILSVGTEPAGPDAFGSVASAHLRLAVSSMLPCTIFSLDVAAKVTNGDNAFDIALDADKDDCLAVTDDLWLLPVLGELLGHLRNNLNIKGIVLQAIGPLKGYFRRVGSFWLDGSEEAEPLLDACISKGVEALTAVAIERLQVEDELAAEYVIEIV